MHIAFRTDASIQIGTGHVMRCLTLADALRKRGAQCTFICRPHTGNLLDLIHQRGHDALSLSLPEAQFTAPTEAVHAHWLGTDWASDAQQTKAALADRAADWLVVDHYALDRRWEQSVRSLVKNIMVIDDLADRPHDCDLLLDQNLGRTESDYSGLLNPGTQTLIGPEYALLRPEFAKWRNSSLKRRVNPTLKSLLITMGGVDKDNSTGQVLAALRNCELPHDLRITVVMGPHAPWLTQVQEQAATMPRPTQVLTGVNNMAQLMAESDLAIGAAGSTNWERCCLGLPCLLLVLADNQESSADALTQAEAVRRVALTSLAVSLSKQISSLTCSDNLAALSVAARAITCGNGAPQVAMQLLQTPNNLSIDI